MPSPTPELIDSFTRTCQEHSSWFLYLATRNLPDALQNDAEDVVQDALLSAWISLAGYSGHGSLQAWISAILVRQAWHHAKNNRHTLTDKISVLGVSIDSFEREVETNEILSQLLPNLSEKQRNLLTDWSQDVFKGDSAPRKHKLYRAKKQLRNIARSKKILKRKEAA